MTRGRLIEYIAGEYGVEPEYLWENDPAACIFRNPHNRKWFTVIMRVRRRSLGQESSPDEYVDIVDFKMSHVEDGADSRILPGYHMNKRHWGTIILDDVTDAEFVFSQINASYEFVA